MIQVSIVSGTYNRFPLLKRMVESVRACVDNLSYEIVLVDGGSTDGTLEWCREQEDVVLVEQGELLGAVKAFNAGFAIARGEYVVILNDDVVVKAGTIEAAYDYLERHGDVGQVAFHHKHERGNKRLSIDKAFGYVYGQCSMIRRWLGDFAGWWGTEYDTYGGDTQLSMVLWEHGWKVVPLEGCIVVDYQYEDQMRIDRRNRLNGNPSEQNVDTKTFLNRWKGRLTPPNLWIGCQNTLSYKASKKTLRTMRMKLVPTGSEPRIGLTDAFSKIGSAHQIDQTKFVATHKTSLSHALIDTIREFEADLLITQIQSQHPLIGVIPTVRREFPNITVVNIDGDGRFPLQKYHYDIIKVFHLQLVSSGTAVQAYNDAEYDNAGLLAHSAERQFFEVERNEHYDADILFLGRNYNHSFPEAEMRRTVVKELSHIEANFTVCGDGWSSLDSINVRKRTNEKHSLNAEMYASAKLGLSISAFTDLYGYTSNRLFNICATGCTALVQRFDGMEQLGFIDGETCIAWTSLNELVEKAEYALENDEWREEIGRAGRELMLQRHTYEHRVAELLSMLSPFEEVSCYKTQMYY